MAPPVPAEKESIPEPGKQMPTSSCAADSFVDIRGTRSHFHQGDDFKEHVKQVTKKLSREGVLIQSNGWTTDARDRLEDELERERDNARNQGSGQSKNSQPRDPAEDKHDEPKAAAGQRRKREDDDDNWESDIERLIKRRNIDTDTDNPASQPPTNSAQAQAAPGVPPDTTTDASTQTKFKPAYPHKLSFPADKGPWYQAIYDQVYKKVYNEIYDEVYSKAYNIAYKDAFEAGYMHGGSNGCHDGSNRGFEDGFNKGYREAYKYSYDEGIQNARDMRGSDDEEMEKGEEAEVEGLKMEILQ